MSSSNSESSFSPHWALLLLLLAYILSFIDRNIMAVLVGPIRADFAINDTQYGLIQGFYFGVIYTFLSIPIGYLADRKNRRNIIGAGVFVWSSDDVVFVVSPKVS